MQNILTFKQLSPDSALTASELRSIAQLIYDTDPYIYPAICSAEDADRIIPQLLSAETDVMFRKENLFLAHREEKILGLILWHSGPLNWDKKGFTAACASQGVTVFPSFDQVAQEYFDMYNNPTADVSIINVCVDKPVRGLGIGTMMLHAFVAQHNGRSIELTTLKENPSAVALYRNAGFCILQEEDGFSVDAVKPRCLAMHRPACSGQCNNVAVL